MEKREPIKHKGSWEETLRGKLEGVEAPLGELPPMVLPTAARAKGSSRGWIIAGISAAAVIALTLLLLRPSDPAEQIIRPSEVTIADAERETIEHTNRELLPEESQRGEEQRSKEQSGEEQCGEEQRLPIQLSQTYRASNEAQSPTDSALEKEAETIDQTVDPTPSQEIEHEEKPQHEPLPPTTAPTEERTSLHTKPGRDRGKAHFSFSGSLLSNNSTPGGEVGDMQLFSASPAPMMLLTSTRRSEPKLQELPVLDLGMSVGIPITSRLHALTGLAYSWRRVIATHTNFGMDLSEQLDVHSLGVRLGIQYAFYQTNKWRWYGEAGVLARIPLHSVIYTNAEYPGNATLSVSASTGLGLEYRITHTMGLFGSVGASYDIMRMKSDLTDQPLPPWHVELHAGLRFWLK